VAILIFGVGQLVLPTLAAHIVRGRLAKDGRVISVSVSAFPAVELLFGDADTINVKMATYRGSESQVASRIGQSSGVSHLNMTINTVSSGLVTITAVKVTKRGNHFTGSGRVTESALRSAIPLLESVTPVASHDGQLTLRGTSADLPIVGSVTADADVGVENGKVVVAGRGLLGSFLHLTVWSNPKVYVESLAGTAASQAIALSAVWRLG
jgi:hypothetical protein